MMACSEKKDKDYISGLRNSGANSIEVWYADFMIANIIKYCDDLPSTKSLKDVNPRHEICNPIHQLHEEVSKILMDREVFVWLNSYFFNQAKITMRDNELRALYRYYYLYNSPNLREFAERKMGLPLDRYFMMSFFVYALFAKDNHFYVKNEYFLPKGKQLDRLNMSALEYVLSQISLTLPEIKSLCKEFCNYDEERIFSFYNNAPHVKYPLIKERDGYFCTIPNYIPLVLLDGLYYRLDIPNSNGTSVGKEFSENLENYLGFVFDHFLKRSRVKYRKEITYDTIKEKSQKTSDWILWDKDNICFMDCKTKRISVKGKQSVTVDDEAIERVVSDQPFSSSRKKKEIDEAIQEGITKDLINMGIGVGKVLVSYDAYKGGKISDFPYMEGKRFHAVLVTLEESFSNTPGYKDRIVKVALSYRQYKSGQSELIDEKLIKILSVRNIEECACIIANEGIGFYLDNHMDNELIGKKWVKDNYLVDRCNDELINPFLEDIKPYYG